MCPTVLISGRFENTDLSNSCQVSSFLQGQMYFKKTFQVGVCGVVDSVTKRAQSSIKHIAG